MTKFGRIIHRLSEVDSTNNYASNLLQRNLAENGTAIVADFQTAGKGQRGNKWLAEPNQNLLVTYVLKPPHELLSQQFYLSKCVALGVVEGVQNWAQQEVGHPIAQVNTCVKPNEQG